MSVERPQHLHEDQIEIPDALVVALVSSQFPQWAREPLRRIGGDGTIHRVDRLGDDKVVRLPFIGWAVDDVERDRERLPVLEAALPVRVPRLLGEGEPAPGMPWRWGVYEWIEGRHPRAGDPHDEQALVDGLATTLRALHAIPAQGPGAITHPSVAMFDFRADDQATRPHVESLMAVADPAAAAAALGAWDSAVATEPWDGTPTWIHGDLVPGNLLMSASEQPHLTAILDWGASGVGDPAWDLLPAWASLSSPARALFFDAVGATPAQIARARGYAVRKAAYGLEYYRRTLPGFAATMAFVLDQVAADHA